MKRTNQQNAWYWPGIVHEALDIYKADPKKLLRDVALMVKLDFTEDFVHELFKNLFNGGKSTQFKDDPGAPEKGKTGTMKMIEYTDKIRGHFYHEHKDFIEDPNPLNEEAI